MKTVSVVMCTYNGAKYLREQLDSILNQTYPIYELIVQDDCSTDETVDIVKEYFLKYDFIKIHQNTQQKGITQNFISAIHLAKGEYIAISDQDPLNIDRRVPNYGLERLIFYPVIPGHAMLFKKELVNLLPEEKNWSYDAQLAIAANIYGGKLSVCKEFMTKHRRHIKAASYVKPDNNRRTINNIISYIVD